MSALCACIDLGITSKCALNEEKAIIRQAFNILATSDNNSSCGDIPIFLTGLGSSIKNHAIVAAAISVVLVAVYWWWFEPGIVLLLVYLLVALAAVVSVPLMYRFAGYTEADELEWLEEREAVEHAEMSGRLRETRSELEKLGITEGVRQADMLSGILDDYHSVVETRFIGKKHGPLAYLSAARKVQLHAVQNLTDAVAVGHSIATINRNTFSGETSQRADHQAGLHAEQSGRVSQLLQDNQKLFDALTDTAVEVANITSFSRYDRIDTLGRLVSLAEIANSAGT